MVAELAGWVAGGSDAAAQKKIIPAVTPIISWQGGYRPPAPPLRAFGQIGMTIIGGDDYRG